MKLTKLKDNLQRHSYLSTPLVPITTHKLGGGPQMQPAKAKIEKVRRPTVSAAGSSEEWSYFETRWEDYVEATKITGKDKVIQLLECCDEPLRKDLTRNAGGSLTNKSVKEVMAIVTILKTFAAAKTSPN